MWDCLFGWVKDNRELSVGFGLKQEKIVNKLDLNEVRDFYNTTPAIWAPADHWHQWSYNQINKYLSKLNISAQEHVLNAGSGGNSYNINCNMTHVDIAAEKLKSIPDAVISSIEDMPFTASVFNRIICVGSVINYCDASATITEFSRVLKPNGMLILEFENSGGYEYKGTPVYTKSAGIVTVKFQGQDHQQWLYSLPYIKSLLKANSFYIENIYAFQIFSSFALHLCGDDAKAAKYARLDWIARKVPQISAHANNFIIRCKKL